MQVKSEPSLCVCIHNLLPYWYTLHDSRCSVAGNVAVCEGGGDMCVCDPQVVQWTQQTTTVGVLCSCSFSLAVRLSRGGVWLLARQL